jgi:coenzyme F420-reducing hydrogenase delta subunit
MDESYLKIYLFCCLSNFAPEELASHYGEYINELKMVPILYLTKAFETGADGVAIVTCKTGECRYLEGNLRAKKRAEAVEALTEEIGLGKGRVTVIQIGEEGIAGVARELRSFRSRIKALSVPIIPAG